MGVVEKPAVEFKYSGTREQQFAFAKETTALEFASVWTGKRSGRKLGENFGAESDHQSAILGSCVESKSAVSYDHPFNSDDAWRLMLAISTVLMEPRDRRRTTRR